MDADGLYDLPGEEFVAARDALAKELRAAGDRDGAAAVGKLRRPTAAAAAVNRLVRARGAGVQELFAAGDALQAAQAALLAGTGDRDALRTATAEVRERVAGLVADARALAGEHGGAPGAAILDRIAETLHAAAVDADARAAVAEGRLEKELRQVGLGLEGLPDPPARPAKPKGRQAVAAEPAPKPDRAAAAREAQRAAAAERKRLRAAATRAQRAADTAARHARVAEERRDRAAAALDEAQAAFDAAQAAAAEAEREAQEAERAADEA